MKLRRIITSGSLIMIPSFFSAQECNDIITVADDLDVHQANIGAKDKSDLDLSTRDSRIRWLGKTESMA